MERLLYNLAHSHGQAVLTSSSFLQVSTLEQAPLDFALLHT